MTSKQQEILDQLDIWKRPYDLGRVVNSSGVIGHTLQRLLELGLIERRPCTESSWKGNRVNYEYKRCVKKSSAD